MTSGSADYQPSWGTAEHVPAEEFLAARASARSSRSTPAPF